MQTRKGLIAAGVLILIAGASFVWLGSNLNALVKKGVERYGPRVTQTNVRLGSVDLELREGRGTLRSLRIANPDGFSDADAISLGEITLDIEPGSLTREPIVIETIRIAGPSLLLEIAEGGAVNLRSLQENVNAYRPGSKTDSGNASESSPPPRLRVDELTVEGGTLALDATAVGGERSERSLGSFTLTGLGGADGVPADQMGQEVLRAILRRAMEQGALDELKQRTKDALGEEAGALIDRITGK